MSTDYRALCAELATELEAWEKADDQFSEGGTIRADANYGLAPRARAALAQPEPEVPTDEEIMELMPQQMHEDLAASARAMAGQAGTDNRNVTGMMRIILNRHAVDLARAAQWGANKELEACCEYMKHEDFHGFAKELRAARRPKPPSLKEQALDAYSALRYGPDGDRNEVQDWNAIRRALEALTDD